MYLSTVKAVRKREEAFMARNWEKTMREQPREPHTHLSPRMW